MIRYMNEQPQKSSYLYLGPNLLSQKVIPKYYWTYEQSGYIDTNFIQTSAGTHWPYNIVM